MGKHAWGKALSIPSMLVLALFAVAILWWVSISLGGLKETPHNYLYGVLLGFIPLVGGLFGIKNAQVWGLFSSAIGRAVLCLSAGLITWALGTFIFAYFNLQGTEVPYPSWADAAYIVSWPLWGLGMIYLSQATGARFGLRKPGGKVVLLAIPILVIMISYYLLVVVARAGSVTSNESALKIFFDLAYPIGDVVILALATLVYGLSFEFLGGRYKPAIYIILAGFVANYLADFSFSYTTTLETFYVAGWVDGLFTVAMFLLSMGVTQLSVPPLEVSAKEGSTINTAA